MPRRRDRASAAGLLPRMEARPHKDGTTTTYRYHPVGGRPINLGTDKADALRRVVAMLGGPEAGTISSLWHDYRRSPAWAGLRERTRGDYEAYSAPLLRVFGSVHAADITPADLARYLRVERASAPIRANREIALLGNLIGLAVERGEADRNVCRGGQVRRNTERARDVLPDPADMAALIEYADARGGQWRVIVLAAQFAALTGCRQAEMLGLHWPQWDEAEVRVKRAKQRAGVEKREAISSSPALLDLRTKLQALASNPALGAVFPNRKGNAYTAAGFAAMWGKLMRSALADGKVSSRFRFHDLRAHYTSAHKAARDALPDLHASPTTTAARYDRTRVRRRDAL